MKIQMASCVALLLLCGCSREHSTAIPGLTSNTPAPKPLTVLVMGQSNAVRWNPNGYKGWNTARGSADTFINCAVNGSLIGQWAIGDVNDQACVSAVAGRHIDVIVWYQGESDAIPGGHALDYAYTLTGLFRSWRSRWGDVPILFAQIAVVDTGRLPEFTMWQTVKDQQASIVFPKAVMVRTDDIAIGNPLTLDGIHFDDAGDYEVGARFARAMVDRT